MRVNEHCAACLLDKQRQKTDDPEYLGLVTRILAERKESDTAPYMVYLFNKAYEQGLLTKVIATNLTYRRPEVQSAPWFVEADMSKYISYIIATLNHDRTLSKLLNPYNRIKRLLDRYQAEQAADGIRLV